MTSEAENWKEGGARIAIAGAGVIGLSCAFELASRGHSVIAFDPSAPSASTSWAAAGMIGPAYEMMKHGGGPLADLCFDSAALWEGFAERVKAASGLPVGYDASATLAIARDSKEHEALQSAQAALAERGVQTGWVGARAARDRFGISQAAAGVLEIGSDHQVDNRRLLGALRAALRALGGEVRQRAVTNAEEIAAALNRTPDAIIWARGSEEFGVSAGVKGQALSLAPFSDGPRRVMRFGSGYIVPKPDRIVIGATSEENWQHKGVSPAVTAELLEAACEVMPALRRSEVLERWAGIRPRSEDGAPLIGRTGENEFVAAAHYRNGVLLAPATAAMIADLVEDKRPRMDAAAFTPTRVRPATA